MMNADQTKTKRFKPLTLNPPFQRVSASYGLLSKTFFIGR